MMEEEKGTKAPAKMFVSNLISRVSFGRMTVTAAAPSSAIPRSSSFSTSTQSPLSSKRIFTVAQQYAKNGPTTDPAGPLFAHQPSLPKLPVPTLEETCAKYLKTLRPILNDAQYEKSKAAVEDFLKPGGVGRVLQGKLEEKAAKSETSWLIEWWNDYAYFAYRDPVVIYVSYFFQFVDEKRPKFKSQTARAASIVKAAMEFRKLINSEQLKPDGGGKSAPLCSMMYRFLFNACRIPIIPSDTTVCYEPEGNTHVAVVRKNQFFVFDLNHPDGSPLSTWEIEAQLKTIIQNAGADSDPNPLGALTSENRDNWAKARDELLKVDKANAELLEKIQSAVFVLCLDDTKPVTNEEVGRACWHGDGKNRFFDKSLQFIVFENGKAGFNGEHSIMDATPTNRLCEFVLESLAEDQINHGSEILTKSLPVPEKLSFTLNPALKTAILNAQIQFKGHVEKHQVSQLTFDHYGKDFIKSAKLSPDAFMQMAIQLAYYKMYGVSRPTYESSQTRKFGYGRTETTRTVSHESIAFVKAMEDASVSAKNKADLLRKAIGSHTAFMADAVDGKGVDRHLLGLRLIAGEMNIAKPEIFTDPAYAYSCHWNLSTSQISSEYYDNWGWGEVVEDGYGIPYSIKEKSLCFWVASQHLHSDRLTHYLRESLLDMKAVLDESGKWTSKSKL